MNGTHKKQEAIEAVFITLSICKVDFKTDKTNCLSMFESFKKNLEKFDKSQNRKEQKKICDAYHIVMEYGATGDNPHLHIFIHFSKPLNWTQINRIVKNPVRKNVNPLLWSKYSCKSKIARNVPYLLTQYHRKEVAHELLAEHNIEWDLL